MFVNITSHNQRSATLAIRGRDNFYSKKEKSSAYANTLYRVNAVNATITTTQKELDDLRKALPTREEFVELIHSYLKPYLKRRI